MSFVRACLRPAVAFALAITCASSISAGFAAAAPEGGAEALTMNEARAIAKAALEAASKTPSAPGLRNPAAAAAAATTASARMCRMQVAICGREGRVMHHTADADAWTGSRDIAIAKARTAAFFSSDENALSTRDIGKLALPGQPLYGIQQSNQQGTTGDGTTRNGIIIFAGGLPLYKNGHLVGGIGVSGDSIDNDEACAGAGQGQYAKQP